MLIGYTKRYVNTVSLIITIIIFTFINNLISFEKVEINPYSILKIFKRDIVQVELSSNSIKKETKEVHQNNYSITKEEAIEEKQWKIIIPSISLEAEIAEGTSQNVMSRYVGHFEETPKSNGNVGLAAHNRGYEVNYFSSLKKLKEGDEIIYKYYDFEKTYIVDKNIIITDEDWSYLENTEEQTITLITCVENEPSYRRCVQAIEKEEVR